MPMLYPTDKQVWVLAGLKVSFATNTPTLKGKKYLKKCVRSSYHEPTPHPF